MLRFLRCVAEAVVEKGLKGLVGMVPGGAYAWDLAERVWAKLQRASEVEQRAALEAVAGQSAEQARQAGAEAAREVLAGAAGDDGIALELYLAAVPEAVRQSLKRPDDPSGKSVPAGLSLRSPEDVLKLLPARPPQFRPGAHLPERRGWVLERLLGVGGFGEVWLARNLDTEVVGAVKFCHGEQGRDLKHEAAVVKRLRQADDHPNIVKVKDACLDIDVPWLMFDYVAGGTLTDWIYALQNLAPDKRRERVLAVFGQLVDAVAFCHRLTPPIVHRDLKPANVLIDATGSPRVTDFGIGSVLAKATLREETRGQSTRGGRLLTYLRGSHTPLYASPQQREGAEPDVRDDVYALGVIAYQMLTGHLAQGAGADFADDLTDAGAETALIDLLRKCVAQKAERRPADAHALAMQLAALVGSPPLPVAATPVPEQPLPAFAPTEWEVTVPGTLNRRPANDPNAAWETVCETPARIQTRAGEVYRLGIGSIEPTTDELLARLAPLARLTALQELNLYHCEQVTDAGLAHVGQLGALRRLSLSSEQVTDAGLAHLGRLTSLQELSLVDCKQLTDAGLAHLGRLTSLQELNLSGDTHITGAGLAHLGGLTALRVLKLSYNKQSIDAGLASLGRLPALQDLNLSACAQLTDAGLASLARLTALQRLNLSGCEQLTGSGLIHLGRLAALRDLDLSGNKQSTDAGLAHLGRLAGLQRLNLARCERLTDAGLAHLSGLTALQELTLHKCTQLTDTGLASLARLTALRHLSLSNCDRLTGAGLAHLGGLTALQELDLSSDGLTDEGLAHVAQFNTLQELRLWGCDQITDAGLACLRSLPDLRKLTLAFCAQVTGTGLTGYPTLESLNLSNCRQVTDAGLTSLRGYLLANPLRDLDLTECSQVTDAGLAHLSRLYALETLCLYDCSEVTDAGLAHLAGLTALQHLNLGGCRQVTDAGLAHLAGLTALRYLTLWGCRRVTDEGLAHLRRLTALEWLDLTSCRLSDEGLVHLSRFTGLRTLSLSGCAKVTDDGIARLRAALPRCSISGGPDPWTDPSALALPL